MDDHGLTTFALETYVRKSFNYLNNMVDGNGLPYFNIFWTKPAEAAHDWPDFGDVMPRQLQAAVMARRMTGKRVELEDTWYKKVLSYIDDDTGLLFRPKTNFSDHVADIGDQGLTLYALITAFTDNGDESLGKIILKMVDSLWKKFKETDISPGTAGFILKPLMVCGRYLDYEPAVKLAERIVNKIFYESSLFTPDNTFKHGGHMHGNLRTLAGAADYALYAHDPIIYSRVDAIFRYVKSVTTSFGFLPEVIGRKDDIIACETCALMDYLGIATTLANHGHPEYWGDIERMVRNHLVESQANDLSWLESGPAAEDSDQFTWREIGKRMLGGYAGWSSPNHFLACRETLNYHWGGPELKNKTRVFQNCCGGSGTHALFTAWKNAARFTNGTLLVNMHIDKLLPQAEIRCRQPYEGLLTVELKQSCNVNIRIPGFVKAEDIRAESSGEEINANIRGNYMELGQRKKGELLKIMYPLSVFTGDVVVGNPGFKEYRYKTTWKGDTVAKIEPVNNEHDTGYSDFDKKEVPVYYGTRGPSPLYRREYLLGDGNEPRLAEIYIDKGDLDFWHIG